MSVAGRSGRTVAVWDRKLRNSPLLSGISVALQFFVIGSTGQQLEHFLTLISERQKLTAANIANADTPGYRTRDIDFSTELTRALQGESARATEVSGLVVKNDGNNVSLDRESRLLAENALRFNLAVSLLRSHLGMVRSAIREGRGA